MFPARSDTDVLRPSMRVSVAGILRDSKVLMVTLWCGALMSSQKTSGSVFPEKTGGKVSHP